MRQILEKNFKCKGKSFLEVPSFTKSRCSICRPITTAPILLFEREVSALRVMGLAWPRLASNICFGAAAWAQRTHYKGKSLENFGWRPKFKCEPKI